MRRLLPCAALLFASVLPGRAVGAYYGVRSDLASTDVVGSTDEAGVSIALDGDTAIVGAPKTSVGANTEAGAARVFVRSGAVWSQQGKLVASDARTGAWLGHAAAVSGDVALLGAPLDSEKGTGAAYVFLRSGTTWAQSTKLFPKDAAVGAAFGYAVAIEGNTALVGAYLTDVGGKPRVGAVHVFVRSGGAWSEQAKLVAARTRRHRPAAASPPAPPARSRATCATALALALRRRRPAANTRATLRARRAMRSARRTSSVQPTRSARRRRPAPRRRATARPAPRRASAAAGDASTASAATSPAADSASHARSRGARAPARQRWVHHSSAVRGAAPTARHARANATASTAQPASTHRAPRRAVARARLARRSGARATARVRVSSRPASCAVRTAATRSPADVARPAASMRSAATAIAAKQARARLGSKRAVPPTFDRRRGSTARRTVVASSASRRAGCAAKGAQPPRSARRATCAASPRRTASVRRERRGTTAAAVSRAVATRSQGFSSRSSPSLASRERREQGHGRDQTVTASRAWPADASRFGTRRTRRPRRARLPRYRRRRRRLREPFLPWLPRCPADSTLNRASDPHDEYFRRIESRWTGSFFRVGWMRRLFARCPPPRVDATARPLTQKDTQGGVQLLADLARARRYEPVQAETCGGSRRCS